MGTVQIILLTLLCILGVIFLLSLISCEVLFRFTIKKNSLCAKIVKKYTYKDLSKYLIDLDWWKTIKKEKVKIKSYDKLKLVGSYIDNKSNKVALVVHGYGACSLEMQQYVKMFYEFGFNVLVVDDRAHGESGGKVITMGWKDRKDVESWVNYLCDRNKNSEIVVFGLSMGAATVCLYSAMEKPENVKMIISDCAYSSAYDVFENVAQRSIIFHLMSVLAPFNIYSKIRGGYKIKDVDVAKAVESCDVPILYIHGDKDEFVPFYMRDRLYDHTPAKFRSKFTVEGAAHAESLPKARDKYVIEIEKFLNKNGMKIKENNQN